MSTGMPPERWTPANEVERRLRDAVDANDVAEVHRILADAPLVLPGYPDERDEESGVGRQRVLTRERDGVPYLLVFTSVESMRRAVGIESWRPTTLAELAAGWSELTGPAPWGLAVNPVTPIGVLIAPESVADLTPAPEPTADFTPANEVERLLRDALAARDVEVFLDVLVTSQVVVPNRALDVDGTPTVAVFTSVERYDDYLADLKVPTLHLDLVAVLRQWPDDEHQLAVNPGSPIDFWLPGDRVPVLLRHAADLAARWVGDGDPAGSPPVAPPPSPPVPVDDDRPERVVAVDDPQPELPPGRGIADLLRGWG